MLHVRNFDWDIRGGANTLHNQLTRASATSRRSTLGVGRTVVGQQLGVEVANKVLSTNLASGVVYVSDTLTPVGNQLPTLEWSFTNTFTLFKNVRVTALFDAKKGFSVLNETAYFRETQLVRSNARLDPTVLGPTEFLRRFGNQTPGQPSFIDSGYVAGSATASAHTYTVATADQDYYQPGDFVRLRELSVAYTLPQTYLGVFHNKICGLPRSPSHSRM